MRDLGEFVSAARGAVDADPLLSGGHAVNVFTHEIVETAVALRGDRIVAIGRRARSPTSTAATGVRG